MHNTLNGNIYNHTQEYKGESMDLEKGLFSQTLLNLSVFERWFNSLLKK